LYALLDRTLVIGSHFSEAHIKDFAGQFDERWGCY
jgi:hypothetical protein